jgi:tetratricopeptide (TPR) repeat protein
MKKKAAAKVKRSSANLKKKKRKADRGGGAVRMTLPTQAGLSPVTDPHYAQAVENYQAGLKAMQEHKFEKAKALLQKVVAGGPRELADRAAVHLSSCNQRMARAATTFKTPEEHYDYAVSLMNVGDYVGAREHLEKILKQNAKADYAVYGLAVLDCLTGHYENSLKGLAEAIRLNPGNRFQARNDSDFQNLADDPRFTELIYPEVEESPKGNDWR